MWIEERVSPGLLPKDADVAERRAPSPLVGEGVMRSMTDEGCRAERGGFEPIRSAAIHDNVSHERTGPSRAYGPLGDETQQKEVRKIGAPRGEFFTRGSFTRGSKPSRFARLPLIRPAPPATFPLKGGRKERT
jgi:hypothetical protein